MPFLCALIASNALAAAPSPDAIDAAIAQGRAFLFSVQQPDGTWEIAPAPPPGPLKKQPDDPKASDENNQFGGRTALAVYALLEAGEPATSPELAKAIGLLRSTTSVSTYVLSLRCQVWAALPQTGENKQALRRDATALLNLKKLTKEKNLVWDWAVFNPVRPGGYYHMNNVQYAATGLAAAGEAGFEVPPDVWKGIEKTFEAGQLADGGWTRVIVTAKDKPTPPTMFNTATAVASLFLAQDYARADAYAAPRGNATNPTAEKGLKWVVDRFVPTSTDPKAAGYENVHRRFYGIGMAALASGLRRFGEHDWYAAGAEELVRRQSAKDGNWGATAAAGDLRLMDTAWAILFLQRCRVPTVVNKLDYTPASADAKKALWNQRPRDAANAVKWAGRAMERELRWQIVTTGDTVDALLEAPVLYVAGGEALDLSADAKAKLKTYVHSGGLVFAAADANNAAFARSVEKLAVELFPGNEWRDVPDAHPIFVTQMFKRPAFKAKPALRALGNGVREFVVLVPTGDPAKTWQQRSGRINPDAWQLAADVISYAGDKSHFFARGRSWLAPATLDTPRRKVRVARLKYDGPWDPEPLAMTQFGRYGRARDLGLTLSTVDAGDAIRDADVLYVTGTGTFVFDAKTRDAVKTYLDTGGRVIFEAAGGSAAFAASAQTELTRWYGADAVKTLPPTHALYGDKINVAYRGYNQSAIENTSVPQLRGVEANGRVVALLSREDLSAGLLGVPTDGITGYTPESARSLLLRVLSRWK